jgi:hypothetical protein
MMYNDDSIRRNREYFVAIYAFQDGGRQVFTYEKPTVGGSARITPVYGRDSRQYTGAAHTHAAYDPKRGPLNNEFSNEDKDHATTKGLAIYVATPNGWLQMYDPITRSTSIVSTLLPSDPNDPNRQNTVSRTTNTTDDTIRETWDKFVDFVFNLFVK